MTGNPSLLSRLAPLLAMSTAASAWSVFWMRSQIRSLESQLHEAHHDPLTGVPLRRLADAQLDVPGRGSLALVDLDLLHDLNHDHGHEFGDSCIRLLARELSTAGHGGFVGRLGGDEFVVISHETPSRLRELTAPATSLQVACRGRQVTVTASIGIVGFSGRPRDVVGAADLALQRAKRSNTLRVAIHDLRLDGEPPHDGFRPRTRRRDRGVRLVPEGTV